MIARTVCVARLSTPHSSLLDSTSLNRMCRGAADVYYFKLYANFHKPNSIFLVGRVITKTSEELKVHAKRTFLFFVCCKIDLPNYRKTSGCCTAELKIFWRISARLVTHQANLSGIAYVEDMWHYRLFHVAARHIPAMQGLKAAGESKHKTKGNLYSPGISSLV